MTPLQDLISRTASLATPHSNERRLSLLRNPPGSCWSRRSSVTVDRNPLPTRMRRPSERRGRSGRFSSRIFIALVQAPFYDWLGAPLVIVMIAIALAAREARSPGSRIDEPIRRHIERSERLPDLAKAREAPTEFWLPRGDWSLRRALIDVRRTGPSSAPCRVADGGVAHSRQASPRRGVHPPDRRCAGIWVAPMSSRRRGQAIGRPGHRRHRFEHHP